MLKKSAETPYQRPLSKTPYGADSLYDPDFYTNTIPTGFKRGLKDLRFLIKIRFGWEIEPTGPGSETVIFSKIDTYGAVP